MTGNLNCGCKASAIEKLSIVMYPCVDNPSDEMISAMRPTAFSYCEGTNLKSNMVLALIIWNDQHTPCLKNIHELEAHLSPDCATTVTPVCHCTSATGGLVMTVEARVLIHGCGGFLAFPARRILPIHVFEPYPDWT